MKKIVLFIGIIFLTFYFLPSTAYKDYTKEEKAKLWKRVENGNKDATNQLLLYYTTHDLKKNSHKIVKLQRIGLDKDDDFSCYLFGKFLVQNFSRNSEEFKEGLIWLKHSMIMGNKEAQILLTKYGKSISSSSD